MVGRISDLEHELQRTKEQARNALEIFKAQDAQLDARLQELNRSCLLRKSIP